MFLTQEQTFGSMVQAKAERTKGDMLMMTQTKVKVSIARDPARCQEKKATATHEMVVKLDGEAGTTVLIKTTHSTAETGVNHANGQESLPATKADAETDGQQVPHQAVPDGKTLRMTMINGRAIAEVPPDSRAQSDQIHGLLIHGRTTMANGK